MSVYEHFEFTFIFLSKIKRDIILYLISFLYLCTVLIIG